MCFLLAMYVVCQRYKNSDKILLGLLQYGDCSKRNNLISITLAVAVHMLDLKTNWKHAENEMPEGLLELWDDSK